MLTLDALFAPHGASGFLREILGRSALHLPGEPGKFTNLISWRDLNRLLEFGGLSFPRLRVVKGGEELPGDLYCGAGASGYPRPLVRELTSLLRDGAVLAIQCINELHEPVGALCQTLEGGLRLPVQADLFANCFDSPAAPGRWNDQDLIIIQIEGGREWALYPPTRVTPNNITDPVGEPAWHGILNAFDLLYAPRGWWVRSEPVGDHALCLGLRFKHPTALDAVIGLTQRLAAVHTLRWNIPHFGSLEARGNFLSSVQRTLVDACTDPGLILGFLIELCRFAEARRRFCLPWSAEKLPRMPSEECVALPLLRFPEASSIVHSEVDDTCCVFVDGRPLVFPEVLSKLLETIFDRRNATVGHLLNAFGAELPLDQVLACLTELVWNGAVCLQNPDQSPPV